MNSLEKELVLAAKSPNMSAVRFSKMNENALTANYGVTRQQLRQVAVLLDKQLSIGGVPVEEEEPKASKKKEEVVETATVKLKPKKKAKKSSKKKKT